MSDISSELESLKSSTVESWNRAFEPLSQEQGSTEAMRFGKNFRVDLFGALKAAWKTTKFVIKAKAAAVKVFVTPSEAIEITIAGYGAIVQTLSAFIEDVAPEIYLACVVLSAHEEGLTEAELQSKVAEHLSDIDGVDLPWYVVPSKAKLLEAKERLAEPDGYANLMEGLRVREWVTESGGKLIYKPCHFVVRSREG